MRVIVSLELRQGRAHTVRDCSSVSNAIHHAISHFRYVSGHDWVPTTVQVDGAEREVVGKCECCPQYLVETDDYVMAEKCGSLFCRECADDLEAEA